MFQTLDHILRYRAKNTPERTAFLCGEKTFSYGDLHRLAGQAAEFLKKRGIEQGDRFAVLDLNTPGALLLWLGAQRIGAVTVYCNWRFSPAEVEYLLEDSGSKLFFYSESFAEIVARVEGVTGRIPIERFYGDILKEDDGRNRPPDSGSAQASGEWCDGESVLIQLYTSGTTGYPKGVLITHQSMLSMTAGVALELPVFGAGSGNLIVAPLFNIAGSGYIALGIFAGVRTVLKEKFDPRETVVALDQHEITNAFLAPAMIHALLALPDISEFSFQSLKSIHYGGSPMPRPLLERAANVFQCDFTQGYGLTETSGIATLLRFDDHRRGLSPAAVAEQSGRLLSAGRAVPGMEIRILDEDNHEVAPGQPGEVCIRGINMSGGYWKRENDFLDSQGWFHSGDIGTVDDCGFLFLLDRKNDMILSGGMNIYPAEIERILEEHPAIGEAAAVGIPDEKFGERICVFLVCPGNRPTAEEVRQWLSGKMAGYKIPAEVRFQDCLPRNPSGKILRRELRDPFWQGQERNI